MYLVNGLTNDNIQHATLVVGENETCDFKLYFCPTQYSWYFDWTYKNISSKGNKVILSPNILRYYKHRIPFGLAVLSDDYIPPFKIDDFTTRIGLYILNSEEVDAIEEDVFNPTNENILLDNKEVRI